MDEAMIERRGERSRALQIIGHQNPGLAISSLHNPGQDADDEEITYPSAQIIRGREYISPPSFQRMRPESAPTNRRALQIRQAPDFTRARQRHQFGGNDNDMLQMIMRSNSNPAIPGDRAGVDDEHSIMLLNMLVQPLIDGNGDVCDE